ncbi:hypothetical protein GUJ93_ZPchr0012g20235 [Zizania palustris]|uniref:Uncharacterized protein n=1 Tax=Zizania palustris TaxID=103762 RepID=A0A8J5WRU9_ZIZPA|nr:hypothetical protein GUJ93_ZPchr0012g20235 [Zizania palustris]
MLMLLIMLFLRDKRITSCCNRILVCAVGMRKGEVQTRRSVDWSFSFGALKTDVIEKGREEKNWTVLPGDLLRRVPETDERVGLAQFV